MTDRAPHVVAEHKKCATDGDASPRWAAHTVHHAAHGVLAHAVMDRGDAPRRARRSDWGSASCQSRSRCCRSDRPHPSMSAGDGRRPVALRQALTDRTGRHLLARRRGRSSAAWRLPPGNTGPWPSRHGVPPMPGHRSPTTPPSGGSSPGPGGQAWPRGDALLIVLEHLGRHPEGPHRPRQPEDLLGEPGPRRRPSGSNRGPPSRVRLVGRRVTDVASAARSARAGPPRPWHCTMRRFEGVGVVGDLAGPLSTCQP